jgi:hypothetical protein
MQPDPATCPGDNPQNLNRYVYVRDDPANLSDPDGRLVTRPTPLVTPWHVPPNPSDPDGEARNPPRAGGPPNLGAGGGSVLYLSGDSEEGATVGGGIPPGGADDRKRPGKKRPHGPPEEPTQVLSHLQIFVNHMGFKQVFISVDGFRVNFDFPFRYPRFNEPSGTGSSYVNPGQAFLIYENWVPDPARRRGASDSWVHCATCVGCINSRKCEPNAYIVGQPINKTWTISIVPAP